MVDSLSLFSFFSEFITEPLVRDEEGTGEFASLALLTAYCLLISLLLTLRSRLGRNTVNYRKWYLFIIMNVSTLTVFCVPILF